MSTRNNDKHEIVEDRPVMRSVAMMSAPAMPMPRAAPFAKAKPALFMSSEAQVKPSPRPDLSSSIQRWQVKELQPLPQYYMLDRTHVIVDDVLAQDVANRIAFCLRRESIAATCSTDEACVKAETLDHVQFQIRLWAQGAKVIVEVQRTCGCCFLFHQAARAVLRAGKGMEENKPRLTFTIPDTVPHQTEEERKEDLQEGIEIARSLLKRHRVDSHLMAIESLVHLTNMCKCPRFAADSVLNGEFLGTILSLIETASVYKTEELDDIEEEHIAIMHRNALMVLANCLDSLSDAGELGALLEKEGGLKSINLLQALVGDVARAEEKPHDACLAVGCLRRLVESCCETKRRVFELGAPSALESAEKCRHLQLEEAVSKLRRGLTDV